MLGGEKGHLGIYIVDRKLGSKQQAKPFYFITAFMSVTFALSKNFMALCVFMKMSFFLMLFLSLYAINTGDLIEIKAI